MDKAYVIRLKETINSFFSSTGEVRCLLLIFYSQISTRVCTKQLPQEMTIPSLDAETCVSYLKLCHEMLSHLAFFHFLELIPN